jgi:hypothetical protein
LWKTGAKLEQLSCSMIVAKDGGTPVILDDALGYTDQERLKLMGAVLAAAAKKCQIVIILILKKMNGFRRYSKKTLNRSASSMNCGFYHESLFPPHRYVSRIKLFFLRLASPELAIVRVRQRVKAGGHNVPEETIRRRFVSGLRNFEQIHKPIVDEWALYDNSSRMPILVEEGGIQ